MAICLSPNTIRPKVRKQPNRKLATQASPTVIIVMGISYHQGWEAVYLSGQGAGRHYLLAICPIFFEKPNDLLVFLVHVFLDIMTKTQVKYT